MSPPPSPPPRPWHRDWRVWLCLGLFSLFWLVELPFRLLSRLLSIFG